MARPSHAGTTWVPLRENYFATPLLSAKEKAYLVRKSCEAAQEVVERARSTGGPVQWRHIEKYQDVQIYAGQPRGPHGASTQTADIVSMCGVMSVAASVKEVAALFDLSTTRAMKEFSMDNRDLFFDAIVLYNLSPRTKEKPLHQVTAKWIAVKCPRGVEDRDFCYLECQDKFVDSHGRKGWVMCLHSIKLPGCDDLTREFGFVRGSFYHSGVIVVETDRPGYVDVIHMLQMNFKKNTRVSPSFMRERVAFVAKIRMMMRNKRLNEQRYLSDLELVPKKYRSRCTVCQDSFSLLLLRKMNCRKCGEVVCGACSKEFDVKNAKFLETVKLRVCMHCFQLITTVPKSQIPMLEQSRTSTTMSLLGYYEDDQRASFLTQVPSSAAEMAEHNSQQRRTKIFLQSMQRQRSSARVPSSGPPMTTEMYYQTPTRSSQPLRPSQLGVHPSRGSVVDPYTRDTISYVAPSSQQRAPPHSASIFDRPYPAAAAAPQSMPRDYEYNRQIEYVHRQSMGAVPRSRSTSREDAAHARSEARKQHSQSYISAYQYQQQQQLQNQHLMPQSSFEYGMADLPPPVAYPDSLRGSESKRRDSESSESSTGSIDIDAEESRKSANYLQQQQQQYVDDDVGNGERSRANSRLTAPVPPPPSHYSDDIDIRGGHYSGDDIEDDSEGSVGSGDESDVDFSDLSMIRTQSVGVNPVVMHQSLASLRDDEEETKAQEFSDTPALPPPTPSAHRATQEMLGCDSSVASSSFHQLNSGKENIREQTTVTTTETPIGERTSELHEPEPRESGHAYDLRDSELGLDTTMCDTSFLDSDMRQFHDQSWFMKNGRPSFENAETQSTSASQQQQTGSRDGSVHSSERRFSDERSAPTTSKRTPVDTAFTASRPLLSANNHVTSPTNSYEGIPSLYAKPRTNNRTGGKHPQYQRSETIPFKYMDNDRPPPSYSSSASSSLNGSFVHAASRDKENVSRQGSSSSMASSPGRRSKKSVTISDSSASVDEDLGPKSFFGAHSDDIPPIFQQPRSMAGFSATATYEVPKRSVEETKELIRKMSAPGLHAPGNHDEPEHESKAANNLEMWLDDDGDRDSEFGEFDGSILHVDTETNQAQQSHSENESEEEEEDPLLSARSLYKSFGSTLKITSLVGGGDKNSASFQKTFDKIQASIDMLSSDDDSEDERVK